MAGDALTFRVAFVVRWLLWVVRFVVIWPLATMALMALFVLWKDNTTPGKLLVIPDNSVQPGAGNGEPVTAEVLAQQQAEEAIRRETERRADEIVRKMAENKPDLPDGKTEQAVREIAGQERDRTATSERETALPESVLRESQREQEAVREVARENLLQERLQQMERDMVRDLQKEKTLGGD
ncbi:TPA: traI domain protein [Escherichia coli]|nr:traI domain protein [Escherichia coli]HAG8449006.1 traI domain protein [Escherichia coli]HAJ2554004.1 traI domain protein [Escherichia coli]HAZ7128959.1 traI domain protein [Escherichia coli]